MNSSEMVTNFKLEADGNLVKIVDLIKALNQHCKVLLNGESFCCSTALDKPEMRLPTCFLWLIAFAVEGENEGWYVHVGAIVQKRDLSASSGYIDFGTVKVWSIEESFAVQKEAQRFLTAARWN
jgi:hypothetical protein